MWFSKSTANNFLWAAGTAGLLFLALIVSHRVGRINGPTQPQSTASETDTVRRLITKFRGGVTRPSPAGSEDVAATHEIPTAEALKRARDSVAAEGKEARDARERQFRTEFYSSQFAALGLTSEQITAALERLSGLYSKAVTSGDALLELQIDRSRYDREMKKALSSEAYETYRRIESFKPYYSEVRRQIGPFAEDRGVPIDEPTEKLLADLLATHHVTLWESWDGPYDPLPRPGIGPAAALAHVERMLGNLDGLESFLHEAEAQLPNSVFKTVKEYYTEQFTKLQAQKQMLELPEEQRLAIQRAIDEQQLEQLKKATGE